VEVLHSLEKRDGLEDMDDCVGFWRELVVEEVLSIESREWEGDCEKGIFVVVFGVEVSARD
jgi:hypothetical protein